MKKLLLIVLTFLLISAVILGLLSSRGLAFSLGRCIVMDDTCMLILGNTPVQLNNRTGSSGAFATLATGDQLLILHDGIQETWPARTSVYFCLALDSGSMDDIPQSVVDSLVESGWLHRAP